MSRDFAIAVFAILALVLIVAPLFMLLRLLTQFGFGMSGIFGIAG